MQGACLAYAPQPLGHAITLLNRIPQAIETSLDHAKFLASAAKRELLDFILALNKSCIGRRKGKIDARGSTRIAGILSRIRDKVYKVPASSGSHRRFGDAAFRELHAWLVSEAPSFVRDLTTSEKVEELAAYLSRSFGDPQRLDYGTAHETLFVIFLLCLVRLGAVPAEEVSNGGLALVACAEYFSCCRAVQTQYGLEPAGSRGVWSLDDYQCLSFLFGSAQHSSTSAKANYVVGNDLAAPTPDEPDSLFFENLRYAARSKTGASFAETSPILFSLANKSWGQVNRHIFVYYERQVTTLVCTLIKIKIRLARMQVLEKFVVARHLLFGTVFPATWRCKSRRSSLPKEATAPGLASTEDDDAVPPRPSFS